MNVSRVALAVTLVGWAQSSSAADAAREVSLAGAWRIDGTPERVMIITPGYWAQTIYQREQRQFVRTFGGTYSATGEIAEGKIEFDSEEPHRVGEWFSVRVQANEPTMKLIQDDGTTETWTRIDRPAGALAGTWRISGRHGDSGFTEMPLRAHRTLKVLSATRFQWIAFNSETGEFSGTGGGTYTLRDGKYVEQIEFFSRNPERVGARLEFEAAIDNDTWQHRGLSSAGDPIHEVWTRFETQRADL